MGTAYSTETCIRVLWPWLAFPASLILLAMAFLVCVAARTKRRDITWKSSSLPLVFHTGGFAQRVRERYGAPSKIREMNDVAMQMRAQFVAGKLEPIH